MILHKKHNYIVGTHCISQVLLMSNHNIYRIRLNYRTYPYKHTVGQFHSIQITASVLFVCFFIKAYIVGTHLNCTGLSMQFKWVPTTYAFIKKFREKNCISIIREVFRSSFFFFFFFFFSVPLVLVDTYIVFYHTFSQ